MLELKELHLQRNRIAQIDGAHNYPKLEELYLSSNPISLVFPEAFTPLKVLRVLHADNWKLRFPETDLAFLKRVEGTLNRLSLNNSFFKENLDRIYQLSYLKMS